MDTSNSGTELTLSQAQSRVDDWMRTVGVRYFSELTNLAQLMEEVGELARILSRKFGEQSFKGKEAEDCNLADEMADVLFVLICLANQTGVDLTAAFEANLEKKTSRDSTRHKNNPKL
jgi:NTP pyrophosphatase (non-canonical NTP hydrolase)